MANIFNKIITKLRETKYRYLFSRSNVRFSSDSTADISHDARIANSTVVVSNSKVTIGKNCLIKNVRIYIKNGELNIADNSTIQNCFVEITDGKIFISHHSRITCKHLWVRFGGKITIGCYTNLNHGTEVRADELVEIGSYCQISYNINIWDTNTHTLSAPEERKLLAEKYFPKFGYEEKRPDTKPVTIGDYCWLGEHATLLKGTTLGNNVVVGYHTTLTGQHIEDNRTVVQDITIKVL